MKIPITFKDPDGVYDSIMDFVKNEINTIPGLSKDEKEELIGKRHDELSTTLSHWITFGEYLHVIFDTEEKTATVVVKT